MNAHPPVPIARPKDCYSVQYGVATGEWNSSDDCRSRSEAWVLYERYKEHMPELGEHRADYVQIVDEVTGRVLESYTVMSAKRRKEESK